MYQEQKIWVGNSGDKKVYLYPKMANRHGMIAGATGTGKTVTLKVLAESFSDCGIPVFFADVKGDLAAMCRPGSESGSVAERVQKMGLLDEGFNFHSYPVNFWDVYAEKGLPLRTTISEMGPLLLSRIMDLNDTQTAVLTIVFKIADDEELLLIDTKDLRAMLQYVGENSKQYSLKYGNIPTASLGAITRALVALDVTEPVLDEAARMGADGVLSRLVGEFVGSCLTFCSLNGASAPGQLDCERAYDIVCRLHDCRAL